jgi:hypothetical protein
MPYSQPLLPALKNLYIQKMKTFREQFIRHKLIELRFIKENVFLEKNACQLYSEMY